MIGIVVLRMAAYAALGMLIGMAHFGVLAWNVRLYARGGAGWDALLMHLLRLAIAVAAFTLCARQGAAALLACFAGFQAIRALSVWRYRLAPRRVV